MVLMVTFYLTLQYQKPEFIIKQEKAKEYELALMKSEKPPRDGDVQCPQQ